MPVWGIVGLSGAIAKQTLRDIWVANRGGQSADCMQIPKERRGKEETQRNGG